jgi:signal transduction histidine kinase
MLVVALVLFVVSVGVVWFVDRTLTDQVRAVAEVRAQQALVASDIGGGAVVAGDDDGFVRIIEDGRIVAQSPNLEGRRLPPLAPGGESEVVVALEPGDDETEPVLVIARATEDGGVILVGRSLDDVAEARRAVIVALLVGVPLVVLAVGALTWVLVSRALAPIDAMRAEADRISASEMDRRLPETGADDEVGRLARTLNRMLARLEGAQRRQRRFVSDASHELRSPIASIRQHAEVATTGASADARALAETVLPEIERLGSLVDDLLLLARLDEEGPIRAVEVDVDDLVLAEAARLRSRTSLTIDTTGVGAGRGVGNPAQLERVIRNLADNAARHATSTVALSVGSSDGQVVATIDDDGPGIPEGDRARALERFERLDEGRGRGAGGTGLGLAIARDVMRAHGGGLQLATSPLGGLRATVRLPSV